MKVYNLEEFATKYNLKDIYGAYAAHFYVNGEEGDCFSDFDTYEDDSFCNMFAEHTLFTKLLLVQRGSCLRNCMKTMPSRACSSRRTTC